MATQSQHKASSFYEVMFSLITLTIIPVPVRIIKNDQETPFGMMSYQQNDLYLSCVAQQNEMLNHSLS